MSIDRDGKPVAMVWLPRVERTGRGALRRRLELEPDWDAPEVNAEIADEFGVR